MEEVLFSQCSCACSWYPCCSGCFCCHSCCQSYPLSCYLTLACFSCLLQLCSAGFSKQCSKWFQVIITGQQQIALHQCNCQKWSICMWRWGNWSFCFSRSGKKNCNNGFLFIHEIQAIILQRLYKTLFHQLKIDKGIEHFIMFTIKTCCNT